jgi:hypothetical protein
MDYSSQATRLVADTKAVRGKCVQALATTQEQLRRDRRQSTEEKGEIELRRCFERMEIATTEVIPRLQKEISACDLSSRWPRRAWGCCLPVAPSCRSKALLPS